MLEYRTPLLAICDETAVKNLGGINVIPNSFKNAKATYSFLCICSGHNCCDCLLCPLLAWCAKPCLATLVPYLNGAEQLALMGLKL